MSPFTKPIVTRRFVDLERRRFLKTGVVGSALLLAGRWLAPARAADSGAAAGAAFANINAGDARVLERIVPVVLEGALPGNPAQRKAAIGEIIYGVDLTIGYQPAGARQEIRDLFGLLNAGATRALLAGIWRSWDQASDEDIANFLLRWRNSRFDLLRSAYIGLNNLICASWYGNPKAWPRIGYGGPPKIA